MTRELKTLMDRATDRSKSFTPDPAELVAAGRRRVRNRRIAGSLATVAAVGVVAAGAAVAVDLHEPRSVAPATQKSEPTPPPAGPKLCTTSNGEVLGKEVWAWPDLVSISDQYGSASIRREPKSTRYRYTARYAFCITQPAKAATVPLRARGGVLVRKSPIDGGRSMTTVFGRAYGDDLKVVVQTGDGQSGQATVKSDFYLYRHIEARPWPGPMPTVLAKTIEANGYVSAVGRW